MEILLRWVSKYDDWENTLAYYTYKTIHYVFYTETVFLS